MRSEMQQSGVANEYSALVITFTEFDTQREFDDARSALLKNTRHLTRGEMGCEVSVGNNTTNRCIEIDGPSAVVMQFLSFLEAAKFSVISMRPQASVMAIAA